MQGNQKVLDCLNQSLAMEASLNEQYRLNARLFKFLGLKGMKNKMEQFGCDTSDYRRDMLDRLLFLGGTPDYTIDKPVNIDGVAAILQDALAREYAVVIAMNGWLKIAMNANDDNTRNKYEHWIKWHEDDHICWIEKKLKLIGVIGETAYIQEEM